MSCSPLAPAAIVPPPVITSPATVSVTDGVDFEYQITAVGVPGTFGAVGLPDGLALDANSGLISGDAADLCSFTVFATNIGGTGAQVVRVTRIVVPPEPLGVWSFGLASGDTVSPMVGLQRTEAEILSGSGGPLTPPATLPLGVMLGTTTEDLP